jgi:non-ribosomal peptide synthetase component F
LELSLLATHELAHKAPTLCIHELIERQSDLTPAAPALMQGARQISYQQLDCRANQLAHALRRRGVGPDVPVALLPSRDLDSIVALLAILKAGGAYLPLDPAAPLPRQRHMLDDTAPPLLLVGADVRAADLAAIPQLPMSGQGWADDAPSDRPAPLPRPDRSMAEV